MREPKRLYLAYHKHTKAYFNPTRIHQNKLDYETPKLYGNINSLVNKLRCLKSGPSISDWNIYEVRLKLEKLEIDDFWEE